jgi:hypothetical protein
VNQIPTTTDALYSQSVTLDGKDYVLTFALNTRDGRWFLDLADQDGVPIVLSLPLVVNWDLLNRCVDERRPPGKLVCQDPLGNDEDPGPDVAPLLYYVTAEELGG